MAPAPYFCRMESRACSRRASFCAEIGGLELPASMLMTDVSNKLSCTGSVSESSLDERIPSSLIGVPSQSSSSRAQAVL